MAGNASLFPGADQTGFTEHFGMYADRWPRKTQIGCHIRIGHAQSPYHAQDQQPGGICQCLYLLREVLRLCQDVFIHASRFGK